MSAKLKEIVEFLDEELRTGEVPDYPGALNGLQLENDGTVTKVGSAVDATLPVIRKALAAGVDLLVVHHGLFWQGAERITGSYYEKLSNAIAGNLAIYSSHIPLDLHPVHGNNALLASKLADCEWEDYFDFKGVKLGKRTNLKITVGELAKRLEAAVGTSLLRGPVEPERPAGQVGLITGGAGSEIGQMKTLGIDTFISGEAPHWAAGIAEESGVQLLLGGHYATETFGVRALEELVAKRFGMDSEAIHHPSFL